MAYHLTDGLRRLDHPVDCVDMVGKLTAAGVGHDIPGVTANVSENFYVQPAESRWVSIKGHL